MRSTLTTSGTRKLLICLFLGLSAFMAAHIVNAFVADALRLPATLPPPLPVEGPALQQAVPPQQLAAELMARGLFALPAESSQAQGSSADARLGPPLEVAKKILLHGTMLGSGDEPMAIVQDRSNQQQKLLHLHDRVLNVGELVSIEKTRVLFQDKGQEEWLELAMLVDLEQARRIPHPLGSPPGRSIGLAQSTQLTQPAVITPVVAVSTSPPSAPGRPAHIIDRGELAKALADIPHLLLQAQPVVVMTDGRFGGIRLEAVRFDGLYSNMGLQSGDVLKRINGVEIREPSMLIAALEQMKDERRVKFDMVRNETPRTMTYEIR